jgi:adenylate cyclase class IV
VSLVEEKTMNLIEAELKCRLTTEVSHKLRERLQVMQRKGNVHNLDSYYDTASWSLLQRAVFVRIRNQQRLEFKFNEQAEQRHVQCTERTFSLEASGEMLEQMNELFATFLPGWHRAPDVATAIACNGLIELAHIDNRREVYTYGPLELCIDSVAGLGDFLEMEICCPEGPAAEDALTTLQALATDLHAEHIPVGYVELWLREHDLAAYQTGKYRLEP